MRVSVVLGAPGDLDPSFGHAGTVTTNFGWGSSDSIGRAVLRQADGKFVVAGTGWKGIPCFALIRFMPDGSVDTSFGDEGRVLTVLGSPIFSGFQDGIYGLVQEPDGTLVAAGRVAAELGNETTLARYRVDGSLDTTFGAGGVVRVAFSGADDVSALALQDDGKLVVAGYRGDGGGDMLVARFNDDGSLDTEFGDAGAIAVGVAPVGSAEAIVIQADGKLVVAGTDYAPATGWLVVLARFLADGTPDVSFGSGGVVRTNPTDLNDYVSGLLQQDDGRLVVVGTMARGIYRDVMVLRYDVNGALDSGFGSGGLVDTQVGSTVSETAGVVQRPDGRLVVAASALGAAGWEVVAIQYNDDGTLDSSFGSEGVAAADPGRPGVVLRAMLRQSDEAVVVAGDGGSLDGMVLIRFEAAGALDAGFGSGGIATASAASSIDTPAALVVQSDGKLVAVGTTQTWDFPAFALARYDADGRLDPTFGVGGKAVTAVGTGYAQAKGVVQQSGGKLVVAGTVTVDSTMHLGLARYTSNGVLDPTFGTGGVVVSSVGPGNEDVGALLQQGDGKLVITGRSGGDSVLVRYDPDGSFDPGFGDGGTVRVSGLWFDALTQQSDGKLVAAGTTGGISEQFAVARFDVDGTLDQTFSGDGKTFVGGLDVWNVADFGDVLQQVDGKLASAGDHFLMRFGAGGSLDTTFAVRGVAAEPIWVDATGQLPDGTLVGGGYLVYPDYVVRFALTHHDLDGSLDASFGSGGVALAMDGSADSRIADLHVQPDAGIVAFGGSDSDFALARFFGQSTSTSTTSSTTTSSSNSTTTSSSTSSSSVTTTVATTSSTTTTLGCADADADGVCDTGDACVNVGRGRDATRARVTARHVLPAAGDDALVISGTITLPAAIDPVTTGIRVLYGDQAGEIFDVLVPPGAYSSATRTGWTAQGSRYRYVNGDGSLDLVKVVVRGSASTPGQYKVKVKGKGGTYAGSDAALPLHAVLVFAPPFASGVECGEWSFPAVPPAIPSCVGSASGDVVKCR